MSGSTSATEVTAIVAGSTVVVVPLLALTVRLARAERLVPRVVREFPGTARAAAVTAVLTVTALLFLLSPAPTSETTR